MKLQVCKPKQIIDDLTKYCHISKEDSFITITEWANCEGWDININDKIFQLTYGELRAINILTGMIEYNFEDLEQV